MPGKAASKRNNQAELIPIANIKTEKPDAVVNRVTIKTENPDNNNSSRNNSQLCVNIKTEKPDDNDVIFVPNPSTVVVVNDASASAPPPQKKSKLNDGNAQSKDYVHIKKEALSPVRNRGDRNNYNRARNYNNSYTYLPNRGQADAAISDRILRNTTLSASELRLLVTEHRQEIAELFNCLQFKAKCERNQNYVERLIVAKIRIANRCNLSLENIYLSMRRDMVGWIERYQARSQKTPRYYSVFVDKSFIIAMCADSYAYNCLRDYVDETYTTLRYRQVVIEYLPRYNGRILYCYAATADDVVYDTDRFLHQVHLHISNASNRGGAMIYADKWILVQHRIHMAEGCTSFVFFMDYVSHLTLEHVYKNSLSVCMLAVKLSYRGTVPCNF